jgi:hypothetical protein
MIVSSFFISLVLNSNAKNPSRRLHVEKPEEKLDAKTGHWVYKARVFFRNALFALPRHHKRNKKLPICTPDTVIFRHIKKRWLPRKPLISCALRKAAAQHPTEPNPGVAHLKAPLQEIE